MKHKIIETTVWLYTVLIYTYYTNTHKATEHFLH